MLGRIELDLGVTYVPSAGGVVAARLGVADAVRRGAVVLELRLEPDRLEAVLEVRAHRCGEHEKLVVGGRFHADERGRPDQERADVERGAASVRRDEALVDPHEFAYRVDKRLRRELRHHQALGRLLHALAVFIGTERDGAAVFRLEHFESLEALLAVVQARRGDAERDCVLFDNFAVVPLTVAELVTQVAVRFHICERQFAPIQIYSVHGIPHDKYPGYKVCAKCGVSTS
jgi:hypothetical protein